jgi:hypothetical protein
MTCVRFPLAVKSMSLGFKRKGIVSFVRERRDRAESPSVGEETKQPAHGPRAPAAPYPPTPYCLALPKSTVGAWSALAGGW